MKELCRRMHLQSFWKRVSEDWAVIVMEVRVLHARIIIICRYYVAPFQQLLQLELRTQETG